MKSSRSVVVFSFVVGLGALSGLVALADSGAAQQETFMIDQVHSSAIFRILHMGAGPFYGRFNEVGGTIVFDGNDTLELDVTVMIESADTGNERLDGHLKSPDFFNAREFPKMAFKSRSAKKTTGKMYEVVGDLMIHGVTKTVTTQMEWIGTADMGRGKRCGFEAVFTIKRSDFGITMGVADGGLGDDVKVIVGLEAKLQG